MYRDPQLGAASDRVFNAALPVCLAATSNTKNERLTKFVFRALSALPLLDLLSTYLISGEPQSFPNLNAGLLASLMMELLAGNTFGAAEAGSEVVNKLLGDVMRSIKVQSRPVGAGVWREFKKKGYLNPVDSMGKLVSGVLWHARVMKGGAGGAAGVGAQMGAAAGAGEAAAMEVEEAEVGTRYL